MIIERGRGKLQVPVGVVLQGRLAIDPVQLYTPIIGLFEKFVRLGLMKITVPDPASIAHIVTTTESSAATNHATQG